MLRAFALLMTIAVAAGCVSSVPAPAPSAPEPEPSPQDPAAILAGLVVHDRPSGKRALADLEKFVAAAPRRFDNLYDHAKARDWLQKEYEAAGLTVTRHTFTGPAQTPGGAAVKGENILATLPGRDPSRVLMFGAHYDGAFNGYGAAYDDGSGTLITLDLARAMAKYTWNHTLIFASWDQEEAGLVGSRAYVRDLGDAKENITVFVNFDMTGINWPAKFLGTVDVPMRAAFGGDNDRTMVTSWTAAAVHLGFPASAHSTTGGAAASSSDHASFLAAGIPAAWVRGAVIGNYPMYHNVDTVETMIADVGGDRAALEGGFHTVLQTAFHFAFVVDATPAPRLP